MSPTLSPGSAVVSSSAPVFEEPPWAFSSLAEVPMLSFLGRKLLKGPSVGLMQYGKVWTQADSHVGVKWYPVGTAKHVTYTNESLSALNRRSCTLIPKQSLPPELLVQLAKES